jgi:hypothetical protein
MAKKKKTAAKESTPPWRHSLKCKICHFERRAEIEHLFLLWTPHAAIVREYRFTDRNGILRHCKAMGLVEKRIENTRGALAAVIERGLGCSRLHVPAASIVAAAIAMSKLDSDGRTTERFQQLNSHQRFLDDPRWTHREMLAFAERGEMPGWYDESSIAAEMIEGEPN